MYDIPPRYDPKQCEEKWYKFWEENNFFHAKRNPAKKPFSIVIPPPNITGILHMGHALNNTLQDILIRWQRMAGKVSLWMPGTDHAGIATQNVVEKELYQKRIKRQDLGREEFLKEVWQWKEKYGNTIISQLKRLGCSCDWRRLRFTLDEDYSRAVKEVFIRLYQKGLIFRGDYIINWCPRCQTALSDEEAPHKQLKGFLYYIKYPLSSVVRHPSFVSCKEKDTKYEIRNTKYVIVATTRPETMLGDTAVAINPEDKRYKHLIGKRVILPIVNRRLKIIADMSVEPKFGTGVVKVTPAHDAHDFQIAKRHKLDFVTVMNPDGSMNENAGDYQGMDRFECREALITELREQGLLVKLKPYTHAVSHCYRCHTVIEPCLSRQWFVRMKPLAKSAIRVVTEGKVKFCPSRWKKVYLNWMENIQDWCISRQIWWGHRIPVYYCLKCQGKTEIQNSKFKIQNSKTEENTKTGIIVSKIKPKRCPHCGSTELKQDEDVLDTWFSSWLWPFATFGWPKIKSNIKYQISKIEDKEKEITDLDYFYPTSILVTAPEILFFWVARMIMAGIEFTGNIPFRDVYIHGTVRDIKGLKMSKSLGNIIDPIDIINEFGCDALRFSIVYLASSSQDIFLSKEKFELGRNFANKIWNASRFALMYLESSNSAQSLRPKNRPSEQASMSLADKWILSRLNRTIDNVTKALEKFRFNDAGSALYEFFWHEFCDWYLELIKPILTASTSESRTTKTVLFQVLETSLRLLHPFMPFITEEIWQHLKENRKDKIFKNRSIMVSPWPRFERKKINKSAEEKLRFIIVVISAIRNVRSEMNIPPAKRIDVLISTSSETKRDILKESISDIARLSHIGEIKLREKIKHRPKFSAAVLVDNVEIFILFDKETIDLKAERKRLRGKISDIIEEINQIDHKLKNKDFLNKAPREIVSKEKLRLQELKTSRNKLKDILKGIS